MQHILAEGKFGTGGIPSERLTGIPMLADIAKDTAPFDWNVGYDIRNDLIAAAKIADLPAKDQNGSASCGGQMGAYMSEAKISILKKSFKEKSAKFIYAPIAYPDGGGSTEGDIIRRVLEVGTCDEDLCVSYEKGQPPSESFMSNVKDITIEAVQNAFFDKGFSVAYIDPLDMGQMAAAIRDHQGIGFGLRGQNNGTWLSEFPKSATLPLNDPKVWGHWLFAGQARMVNGKRFIFIKNSWGKEIGSNGWQGLSEDHLPCIFAAFAIVYNGKVDSFKHFFSQTLQPGSSGAEVGYLQMALKISGEFPKEQTITNYYGAVTKSAVAAFQTRYASEILIPQRLSAPTYIVGAETRNKLNQLFNKK